MGRKFYPEGLTGLQEKDISLLQQQFGKNIFTRKRSRRLLNTAKGMVKDPMFLLLIAACLLYFILGSSGEAIMMLIAILLVGAVSIYQNARSSRAIKALQQYTMPGIRVIRDGEEKTINPAELVPGDIVVLEEGNNVPADAVVLQSNDCSINEAVITGESFPVAKKAQEGYNVLYQGTTLNAGKCIARVTATGNNTELGRLGKLVSRYDTSPTFLQRQVSLFVNRLALFGIIAFALIFLINYLQSGMPGQSLLLGLTLAMAAIPEEIPVAFSSFMALGAYRMSKLGIIPRQPQVIENVGSVTIICLDKTGTITENRMTVKSIYDFESDSLFDVAGKGLLQHQDVLLYAMLASEKQPFDAMEKAIYEAFDQHTGLQSWHALQMIHEYPLSGQPPMMTHVYSYKGIQLAAAKGAVERMLKVCQPDDETSKKVTAHAKILAAKGYRVIAVASAIHQEGELPADQDLFNWRLIGLLSFYDPPKKNMVGEIRKFYAAGLQVKLLTGDYPETAVTIAREVGISHAHGYLTGEQVMDMNETALQTAVKNVNIFARLFPEAKVKVVNALKANDEMVAMTGDGVNDGPALKSADVGIAMGKKGTDIARQAADLVLTDDNIEKVLIAIAEGRKILSNLRKAVRYIISIHIPIILTAALPLLAGWEYPNIFRPVHVIFLELIMGPTCSIFFEREPVEESIMKRAPRDSRSGLFRHDELLITIVQGITITAGVLILYHYFMTNGYSLQFTRAIVFTTLVISNIFLTFTNRSFTQSFIQTIRYRNKLAPWVLITSVAFLFNIHFIPGIRQLFGFEPIGFTYLLLCSGVAFGSVMWFEGYKMHLKIIR